MEIVSTVVIILFVIDAILLILLVLLQNDQGDSLGGLFSGSSQTAFGSRSSNILIKITSVLALLFFVGAIGLAMLNRPVGVEATKASAEPWYKTPAEKAATDSAAAGTGGLSPAALDAAGTTGTPATTGLEAPAVPATPAPASPATTPAAPATPATTP